MIRAHSCYQADDYIARTLSAAIIEYVALANGAIIATSKADEVDRIFLSFPKFEFSEKKKHSRFKISYCRSTVDLDI